jgi:hypothetical protein
LANWVLPTPPIPRSDCTVTVEPLASSRPSASRSSPRPVKFGLRAGTFHTVGSAPGNRGSRRIARPPGNSGRVAGCALPEIAEDTIVRSRAFAFASLILNMSTLTTPDSRPGRSHSPTRATSSLRCLPSGSRDQAASHSAVPYSDSRYAGDSTAMVRSARATPSCMPWIQLLPGTNSQACTNTLCPSSCKIQAIHSAHARSAWV